LLDESHNDQKLTAKGAIWSIWPDGKLWGRSVELQKFVESLNSRFDSRYRPGKIAMCLPTDSHYEARELSDIYYGTGALFQGVNIPFGNSQTEILLIPGTLVVTLIHLTREGFGNLTLPIGYASTDEKYIKAVEREVTSWGKDESNFNAYFPSSKQDKTNDLINKILG
ncbi:MAG: hypothetical protein HOM11_06935, partial [Methylococcales bacterium]|nr:hypothetical protein [Methylococcales bacterium]